jgi:AcrR family transcriptional regulator
MSMGTVNDATRAKGGRPAKLDRAMIVEAVREVGLARVTMRSVAEQLGMSISALYHYVSGLDELIQLAAEHSAAKLTLPEEHGQHWALWLLEWAEHTRRGFGAEPELLRQYALGTFGIDRMVDHIETVMSVLVRQGFSVREANDAYLLVSECALGAAILDARERNAADQGRDPEQEYRRVLAQRGEHDLPTLRALFTGPMPPRDFHRDIATVLTGVAVQRGEPMEIVHGVIEMLQAANPEHQKR